MVSLLYLCPWSLVTLLHTFSGAELEDEGVLREAATKLVCPATSDHDFASTYELVAAAVSSVHAFRSAVRLERHTYKGGKEVPHISCIYMCVHTHTTTQPHTHTHVCMCVCVYITEHTIHTYKNTHTDVYIGPRLCGGGCAGDFRACLVRPPNQDL
jgi:hypothetical protein